MSLLAFIAAVWLLGPMILFGLTVAVCEWNDRRARARDERDLVIWVAIEQAWDLPPAERRRHA